MAVPHTFSPEDIEAGRAYVKAYVTFMHYIERSHEPSRIQRTAIFLNLPKPACISNSMVYTRQEIPMAFQIPN